jgi:outer membrane receptor protein involved in Fe transport
MKVTIKPGRRMFAGSALAALATAMLMPAAAHAQTAAAAQADAPADDAEQARDDEIVVTGSRLISNGFAAPTPVTVVSGEQLLANTPSTIGEALNKLPQFANSVRPSSAQFAPESGASTQLNLRSLGAQRGLVLLDGRRLNPSTATGVVDIAILPEELVQRVEIVTGGASAAYGSDAVAGVVNFILDTKFEGLKGTFQGGITDRSDNANGKIALTYGTRIGDDLHVIVSGTYYHADGVENYRKREWFQSCAAITNPAVPSVPARLLRCDANTTLMAPGGLITAAPTGGAALVGTQFLNGGQTQPFVYGPLRSRTQMLGGTEEDQGIDFQPLPKLDRMTGYGHVSWDATPDITLFADALIAKSEANYRGTLMQFYDTTALTIFRDNAFLPENIRQRMVDANIQSFTLGTSMPAIGFLQNQGISDTQRYTAGLKAKLGDWTVDAYYEHGTNLQTIRGHKNVTIARVFDSIDAVTNPATGQAICRTTLADPTHLCVPYNAFGPNSASAAAVDFVTHGPGGDGSWTKERTKEDVVEATIRGNPFETWAGPLGVAFGGGFRKDTVRRTVDPGSNGPKISCLQVTPTGCPNAYPIPRGVPSSYLARPLGAYFFSNQQPITGGYEVWEVFGETLIPLARDVPFLQSLDFNGAIRYTHYSLSGGVTTWKAGLSWQPIEDIRFRATRSRDIRAANMVELYSSSPAGAGSINERLTDGSLRTSTVVNLASGNVNLKPERADTLTVGGVFSPSFVPGLQLSVDYYNINISEAIGQLGGQNIVDQCTAGNAALCGLIDRDSAGVIFRVNNGYLNISRVKTRGLDLEASYRRPIGAGSAGLRVIASHVYELSTKVQVGNPVDRAGQTGLSGGIPSWNFNIDLNYRDDSFSFGLNERIIGKGSYDATFVEGRDIDNNRVPAIAYTDLTGAYRFKVGGNVWEVFGTVNNLLDQDPPQGKGQFFVFGTIPTNTNLFDTIGRAYTMGLRIRM